MGYAQGVEGAVSTWWRFHPGAFSFLASVTFLGSLLSASPARATQVTATRVEWRREWTPVSPLEVGGTVALTALSMYLMPRMHGPSEPIWRGGILLDDPVRDLLRLRSPSQQRITARYSDITFRTLALFPYVVDAGLSALLIHRQPHVALQIALIDAEALTLAGVTQMLTSRLLGRERPYVQECKDDGSEAAKRCGSSNDNRSFFSGHAAATFTSAGLTCLHHEHLPLYGGGPVESWACVWAVGMASATSIFRITSDNHYASDVVVGAAIGYLYGYAMPKWLHYGRLRALPGGEHSFVSGLRVSTLPVVGDGAGLQLGGRF